MSIKLACLNVKVLRDRGKIVHLLRDLLSFRVNVAAIQKTHFACVLTTLSSIQHTGTNRQRSFLAGNAFPECEGGPYPRRRGVGLEC